MFVERSEKLSEKTACDVNVGQVKKKAGNSKQSFSSRLGAEVVYLFIKAWEEKSLHKSHLGWFFLVFGEGKATKEKISIFWFI